MKFSINKKWRSAAGIAGLLLVSVVMPVQAQNACELVDADPNAEFDGGSVVSGPNALACGFTNSAESGAVAVGAENTAGLGAVAIGAGNEVFSQSIAIGAGNLSQGEAVVIGNGSVAGVNAVTIGSTSFAADTSVAIGGNAIAQAENSVALGVASTADRVSTVSVGSESIKRQITNVAAGTEATDAVNLSQMQTGDSQTLSLARDYVDQRLGGFDDRLNRAGALSAAMVGMAASAAAVETGKTRVGIAAGTHGGKQALSVGVQHRFGGRVAMTLGGAFSGSESSGTVGVGIGF